MDCSPLGSSVCGILQARILERVAFPPPGDLPDLGIQPGSLTLQAILYHLSPLVSHWFVPTSVFCHFRNVFYLDGITQSITFRDRLLFPWRSELTTGHPSSGSQGADVSQSVSPLTYCRAVCWSQFSALADKSDINSCAAFCVDACFQFSGANAQRQQMLFFKYYYYFLNLARLIIYLFLIKRKPFGHTPRHAGPYLPDQAWSACPYPGRRTLHHWAVREAPAFVFQRIFTACSRPPVPRCVPSEECVRLGSSTAPPALASVPLVVTAVTGVC